MEKNRMCGLVGVFGQPTVRNRALFEDLLCLGVRRGIHSTGLAFLNQESGQILKDAVVPWELLGRENYRKIPNKQYPVMMGHNRHATVGNITKSNAHPFTHKNITLVHNGTLTNKDDLPNHESFDTDSEAICHMFGDLGVDEAYKQLDGAWTLLWWDMEQKTLNVVSNGQRPFFFKYMKDRKGLVWSSEEITLTAACDNRDIEAENTHYYIPKHKLFTFTMSKRGIISCESRELVPLERKLYSDIWKENKKKEKEKKVEINGKKEDKNNGVSNMAGDLISKDEWDKRFQDKTCFFCGTNMKYEYPEAVILDSDTVVCQECSVTADLYSMGLEGMVQ